MPYFCIITLKRKIMKRSIALLTSLLLIGCSVLSAKTVNRTFTEKSPVNKIETSNGLPVTYTVDNNAKETVVTITGSDEQLGHIITKVKGSTLSIYVKNTFGATLSLNGVKISVKGPSLKSIEASSASHLVVKNINDIKGDIKIEASSASSVEMADAVCNELDVESSSGASVTVKVNCRKVELEASSAASIQVSGQATRKADVEASSAGNINIRHLAVPRLEVEASSGACVVHSCKTVKSDVSSGAQVKIR